MKSNLLSRFRHSHFSTLFSTGLSTVFLLSLSTGCGPSGGFMTASSLNPNSINNGVGLPDTGPEFQPMDLNGNVDGGPTDDQSVIVYDVSENAVQVRIPMVGAIGTVNMEIPNVPGSHVYLDSANPLMPVLVVSVPAAYVLGKMGFDAGNVGKDPTKLPNGNSIPFTPGGEPPRISFLIPNLNRKVQVYLGINVVAVFVETTFDPMVDLTFPIKNESETETIGYFSTVRRVVPSLGGFFVSLNMPRRIAGALDDYLRKVIVP